MVSARFCILRPVSISCSARRGAPDQISRLDSGKVGPPAPVFRPPPRTLKSICSFDYSNWRFDLAAAHLPVAVTDYPSLGPRLRSSAGAGSRPRFWRARRSRTSALLPISALRASLSTPDVER